MRSHYNILRLAGDGNSFWRLSLVALFSSLINDENALNVGRDASPIRHSIRCSVNYFIASRYECIVYNLLCN